MKWTVCAGGVEGFSKMFSFVEYMRIKNVSCNELALDWGFLVEIKELLMSLMGLSNELMRFKLVEEFFFSNALNGGMWNLVTTFSGEEQALVVPCHAHPAV